MEEIKQAKIKDLIQDDRNLNKGTEKGQQLIEKSLREFGAGRSLLLDKNNRIIAGNKTHRNAEAIGMDDVIIVETDGTKLVAVKRTDVDLDSKKGREMALADNATVKVDLEWDEDTTGFQKKKRGFRSYNGKPTPDEIFLQMWYTEHFMRRRHIGVFAWLQTGDFIGGENTYLYRPKVMNTTFYLLPYIYRGERGVQDDDTSQFVGILNRGLFTGSYGCGCVLEQMPSATQKGGLTDLYNECKLLNKALVTPIQYPSAIKATRQKKNGARLHHLISYRYLMPKILKIEGGRDNIAWDTYEEDWPFTNEPKRRVENGK